MKIDHDLHVHTYLSSCCQEKETQRPDAILAKAAALGRRMIGFADHVWTNPNVNPSAWYKPQDARQIDRLREDLRGVTSPVRVLVGCEADTIAPGKFSITREFADTLDFVLLACSHFHMSEFVQQPRDRTPRALGEHMLAFFISAVESGLATSIAHPFRPIGSDAIYAQAMDSLSDAELLEALGRAAQRGVALEITTGFLPPVKDPAWTLDTPRRLIALARAAGCRFTLGSDAHSLSAMERLDALEPLLTSLNLTEADLAPIARR